MTARLAAALIAIICWAGLAIKFSVAYGGQHEVVQSLWILARFFTILTNLALAIAMTWSACGGRFSAMALGGLTLAILLVGGVYALLLQGLHELSGSARIADLLLHKISPVATALWWLLFAPRGRLRWTAPLWWTLYPLAYVTYVVGRAQVDGRYPYPFLDIGRLGWLQASLNAGGIALGFIIAGLLLVWIDSWRPLGSKRATG
jgi:hypothetical protein